MKSFVTINLRREMADIRKEITAHKAVMKKYLEAGDASTALFYMEKIDICEAGLKWRAAAIRREQRQRKGGQHG